MWNRKENEMPNTSPQRPSDDGPRQSIVSKEFGDAPSPSSSQIQRTPRGSVGKSICIRGELTGNEDLTIEGTVEGKINLMDHNLIIGPAGRIKAEIGAKKVIIEGEVKGNIVAGEKVELASTGRVLGDIQAPRVVLADGAHFKGMVNMSENAGASARQASTAATTTATATTEIKKQQQKPAMAEERPLAIKTA
jgi:cytoskeletal protein CcmA (bactofilin family)